jgi:hypothetical protein
VERACYARCVVEWVKLFIELLKVIAWPVVVVLIG